VKTVLIVEDSPSIRYEIRKLLYTAGIVTREAGGEFGLFNAIEEYGVLVDLILMDITLKNENGFDLISKLKEIDRYSQIPILILSQHADKDHVLTAKKLGVSAFLRKPIVPSELIEKVQQFLSGKV
jgi:CheY-like chemotaxis protein